MKRWQLIWNWRAVLRYAWSVRFWLLALGFELVSIVLTVDGAFSSDRQHALTFQIIGALFGAAGVLARFVFQQPVNKGDTH